MNILICKDKDNEALIVESIRNLVLSSKELICGFLYCNFIASLGLNVNSTAVIIGAMLISPLMGPIMGVGLAIGQNDFELLKRSLKKLFGGDCIWCDYIHDLFFMTPLDEVQSGCWHVGFLYMMCL